MGNYNEPIKYEVGKEIYLVPSDTRKKPYRARITKIGRKYAYAGIIWVGMTLDESLRLKLKKIEHLWSMVVQMMYTKVKLFTNNISKIKHYNTVFPNN